MTREELLGRLASEPFDILVIGGGIVGAAIARDAALRGLKVALVEQGDFAGGTSSKTSKLIHGGLRYLEHGRLRLVYESLRERRVLRTIAPALVHPLPIALPVYDGSPRAPWQIGLGLRLYEWLAMGQALPADGPAVVGVSQRRPRLVSAHEALRLEPALRAQGLRAAGLFTDCQMDDARLCLAHVLQAVSFGAVCCNYVRLRTLLKARQRVCGGVGEDLLRGRSLEIHAQVVVNATGPWSDEVRRLSDGQAPRRLAPTKGIHLILPRFTREALCVQARADRRMLFILPWGDYSLVGTTETAIEDESLETLSAEAEEVGYLLEEVNHVVQGDRVDEGDVLGTYAGARPLLAFTGGATRASREHRIEEDRWGLVSVMGGKYTTARLMAKQVMDLLVRGRRWRVDRCLTDQVSLMEGVHPMGVDHWQELTRDVDPALLARLLTRYGAGALRILQLIDQDAALAQPVCPHHDHVAAELVYAMQEELACTVTDLLARRTRIAWSSCQGLDLLSTAADLLQRYGRVTPAEVHEQMEAYRRFLASGLSFRAGAAKVQQGVG
ncbi:MAG: glycerol-3-phosphate dehydrogenase/oxidase [Candidatus Omnitrophota bacterium]|nr:glycerol-3-phosphate dehydrogenase/oxidase [Candidatus Omnitrophota bacterium]